MDHELREALDGLRRHIDATAESLSQRIDATAEGLSQRIDATADGLSQRIDATADGLSQRIDATADTLREEIRAGDATTRHHMGVLLEDHRADFRVATEGIDLLNHKFDDLRGDQEQTRRRVDFLEVRVTVLERASSPRPRRRRPR